MQIYSIIHISERLKMKTSIRIPFGLMSLMLVLMFITSCAVTPKDYAKNTPVLDMKTYFNGDIKAWGTFKNYNNNVSKRFYVKINGKWEGNKGILDEKFVYADGTLQSRIWTLVKENEHEFTGTASDVIGVAKGAAYGNALQWKYTMALVDDGETYDVKFDDWMYLIDENTMMNESKLYKFGIEIGEVTLIFQKNGAIASFDSVFAAQKK
jgi:hypothetical protein